MEITGQSASGVRIRPAQVGDAVAMHQAILRFGHNMGQAGKIASTVEDFRRFGFGPEAAFNSVIAEVDGEMGGLCLFFPIFSTWLGKPGVYVQDLYVEEAYRGRKIGETLLKTVAAWSRERGGIYLRLAVDTENTGAQAFYERVGITWMNTDREHGAYGEAFQALAIGREI